MRFNSSVRLVLGLLVLAAGSLRAADDLRRLEPSAKDGSSLAVVVGAVPLVHTTQLLPLDARGGLVGEGKAAEQVEKMLDNLRLTLEAGGSGLDRLVRINVYVARPDVVPAVRKGLAKRFGGFGPAVSFVVGKLAHPRALVAMDAVAAGKKGDGTAVRRLPCRGLYDAGGAHVAVLPAGPKVYVSGQAEKGSLAVATRRTLEKLRSTLKYLGLEDDDVVQVKAFMGPMSAVGEVKKEIADFYGKERVPPVAFVEWKSSVPIEIELVASGARRKERPEAAVEFLTPPGMSASPVFSRVARVNRGDLIYTSGLYGTRADSAAGQIEEIFATLGRLLKEGHSDFRHLAKATYYVSTEDASQKLNELRPRYYDPRRPPAASKAMVPGVGLPGKGITLDMIAVTAP